MKIKAIIFDLDGVLIETKNIHFDALNKAIEKYDKNYVIKYSDHLTRFDGLSTKNKLQLLASDGLGNNFLQKINNEKKNITEKMLRQKLKFNVDIYELFKYFKNLGFKLGIATNAIRKTLDTATNILDIREFLDFTISNEEVRNAKPHSEIYLKSFLHLGLNPKQVVIIEDSKLGRDAAYNSGGYCLEIENFKEDLTIDNILKKISNIEKKEKMQKWKSDKLNILIPMAGHGSRFKEKGYVFPKPLIAIKNKPMIQLAIENLAIEANYNFIILKEHHDKYNIKNVLSLCAENCNIIELDHVTEGAACTSLLSEKFIDNDNPLLIANSDQYIEWDSSETMYSFISSDIDGAILTFQSTHPKWSYAKLDENNFVVEVAEKKPISTNATAGLYYWKKGSDYVKYAKQMIDKNIRVNNEFYICPVYNEAILDKKKIIIKEIKEMWGLGTPEDLEEFMNSKVNSLKHI